MIKVHPHAHFKDKLLVVCTDTKGSRSPVCRLRSGKTKKNGVMYSVGFMPILALSETSRKGVKDHIDRICVMTHYCGESSSDPPDKRRVPPQISVALMAH